LKMLC